jgi:hypothetical protein
MKQRGIKGIKVGLAEGRPERKPFRRKEADGPRDSILSRAGCECRGRYPDPKTEAVPAVGT